MLSFASKMMRRMACTQPPLLLQQRLLTTTSSALVKNSKAPLRPVATHSSKLAGQRRDAHTGVGAVRAMKTMVATAPSRVGQRAFYRTPQAAPLPVVDQLLAYMSADNYVAKKVKEPQSDKTEEDRSKSSKETQPSEKEEVEGLKEEFFDEFKGFEFGTSEANKDFTEYEAVWLAWCAAVPKNVKDHEGPITLKVLEENQTNVGDICERFMRKMGIKVPSKAQLLKATLFLLERLLQRKFYLGKYLEDIKKEILRIQEPNKWKNLFPCPIACAKEEKRAVEAFHVDVKEDCPERKEAQDFFDTSRKAEYVLFIGGESGSGKTHLALNMYTMYREFGVKNAKTEAESELYNDSNSHLTVYIRLGTTAQEEYNAIKNANEKKRGPIEGPDGEEKQRKLSMARNEDVTDLVCKLMCKAVNIHHSEALERLQRVPDSKAEHNDNPKDPMFNATFVVLDEVMNILDVIKACSPKENAKGLLHMIRERGMQKLFGTIYIVCSSTATEDYYRTVGSFPESVIAIQMGPSPNLFNKLTGGKYTALYRNPFSSIVSNRRCAKYASDLLTVLPETEELLKYKPQVPIKEVKNGQLVLGKALPNRFKDYFFGYLIIHVARKYRSVNGLQHLTPNKSRNLLSSAVRTLLTAGSNACTEQDLFETSNDFGNVVTCGVMEVRDTKDKKSGDQERFYNVTHAQLLLAVSSYGTNMITLNTPETYEYFCGSMLLFFLNAFATQNVQLEAFIKMFDTRWKGMSSSSSSSTETPAEGKKGLTLDFTQTGDVLFPSSTMRFPYIGEEATPVEDTAVFKSFCESLQSYAQNAPVCVMCPPQSPFADCFIVAGKCLFLIQCKHTEKVWGSNTLEVVKELRKMGFECEVTPKAMPSTTNENEKKEERENKKWQNSLLFVQALKKKLQLERVIPVFCGTAGIDDTCSEIKARGYGWNVHPMVFNPSISLRATFTRKKDEKNWTFHGTKMVPFEGQELI